MRVLLVEDESDLGVAIKHVVAAQIRLRRRKLSHSGADNPIETLHGMGYRLNLCHESK